MKIYLISISFLLGFFLYTCSGSYINLYQSYNLSDFYPSIEENPGGGTNCPYNLTTDVEIVKFNDRIKLIANANNRKIWINAIAGTQLIEKFPNGDNITLTTYKYSTEFRLNRLPALNVSQIENGGSICSLVSIWDGRGELKNTNGYTMDFAYFWMLNPWDSLYKKFLVYTNYDPLEIHDTGISLQPDLEWHKFEMIVDYQKEKYVSLQIDDLPIGYIGDVNMARVNHQDWINDTRLGVTITVESLPTWPNTSCDYVFRWPVDFRNAVFSKYVPDQTNYSEGINSYFFSFPLNIFCCFLVNFFI